MYGETVTWTAEEVICLEQPEIEEGEQIELLTISSRTRLQFSDLGQILSVEVEDPE